MAYTDYKIACEVRDGASYNITLHIFEGDYVWNEIKEIIEYVRSSFIRTAVVSVDNRVPWNEVVEALNDELATDTTRTPISEQTN